MHAVELLYTYIMYIIGVKLILYTKVHFMVGFHGKVLIVRFFTGTVSHSEHVDLLYRVQGGTLPQESQSHNCHLMRFSMLL